MNEIKEFYFTLSMSYSQCLAYYKGRISAVQVIDDAGRKIRFPANKLLPYMSQIGIRGRFRLLLDAKNKFIRLERVH